MNFIAKRSTILVVSASVALSGCVSTGDLATRFNSDPAVDACSIHRQPLIDTEKTFSDSVIAGAVIGAVGGAVVGLVAGNGRVGGAVAGAVAGAALGGGLGYLEAKRQQAKTTDEILKLVNQDTQADQASFGAAARTISDLQNCRKKELETLNLNLKKKKIDKAAAAVELAAISKRIEEDNQLISAVLQRTEERTEKYIRAVAEEKKISEEIAKAGVIEAANKKTSKRGQSTMTAQSSQWTTSKNAFAAQIDFKTSAIKAGDASLARDQALRDKIALMAASHGLDIPQPAALQIAGAK
jgi:outer membrane lipoprotein SlyB